MPEREYDGVVGRPNGVKEISSDNYRVRPGGKDAINGGAEGAGDIGLPLVDAGRGLPVVLPDAEVGVCNVVLHTQSTTYYPSAASRRAQE